MNRALIHWYFHLKKSCWLISLVMLWGSLSGQADKPWQAKMADPAINFFEVKESFNQEWTGKAYEKGKGFKQYKRWEWFMEPRVWPSGERFEMDRVMRAMQESPQLFTGNTTMPGEWTYNGNTAVPAGGGGAGRVNSVRSQGNSTSILYACAPAGGLWKTTNAGVSWNLMNTDFLAAIGVSDVAIDPVNPNTIYIATGDGDAGDTYALGVLKSTDGGANWLPTGLSWTVGMGRTTNRLLIHPSNSNILIAATSNGLYRTTNAGSNWTQVQAGDFKDLVFKPGDPSVVYACTDEFYRSEDGGINWSLVSSGLPAAASVSRFAVAVSSANPSVVYVLAGSNNYGFGGLYRSVDSGNTFSSRSTSPNLMGWNVNGSDSGGQAWYDLRVIADPANADIVYTGGVNIWKSTDGGVNWSCNAHWSGANGVPYVHADIHAMFFVPGSTTLLIGCDGGVFRTTNGGNTYSDISSDLQIAQQYKLGVSATNSNRILTGWQDNGTNLKDGTTHQQVIGGDGMECIIDPTSVNIMYGSLYYGYILKSTTGAGGFGTAVAGSGGSAGTVNESGAWVTPYVLGTNPNHLFVAKSRVYKSLNGGATFTALGSIPGGNINALAIAPSDNAVIYASKSGSLYRSTDGNNFSEVGGMPGQYITGIAIHQTDPNKVWVTFSGYEAGIKVYETINGGASWTNISGPLPNIPANCIVYQNGTSDGLYIGVDAGVFYRDDNLGTWIPYMNGLPNVIVSELEIHYGTGTLVAATYGRGTWRAPLNSLPSLDIAVGGINFPGGNTCESEVSPQVNVINAGTDPVTSFTMNFWVTGQNVEMFNWNGILPSGNSLDIDLPSYDYGTGSFVFQVAIISVNGGNDENSSNNNALNSYAVINAPPNDVCQTAIPLTVNGSAVGADNSQTCTDGPDPGCGGTGIRDLWYSFVYSTGNIVVETTLGSNPDTRIAVYTSCGGNVIGCNDDTNGIGLASRVTLNCGSLIPGETYYIQAGGYAQSVGSFTLRVYTTGSAPANDVCLSAIPFTSFGNVIATSNQTTCLNGPDPGCGGTGIQDIWYSFVYAGGALSIFTSGGTLSDPRLAVYSSCGGPLIACDDDDGPGTHALINFGCTAGDGSGGQNESTLLVQGATYYIQLGGFDSGTGSVNLNITLAGIPGCTDSAACNYSSCASSNDGSCTYSEVYYMDNDSDGYGNPEMMSLACFPLPGYVTNMDDCDDGDNQVYPGGSELCNGIDDNCNGQTDEGLLNTYYEDSDGDGYGNSAMMTYSCTSPDGYVSDQSDCDDSNGAVYPGAPEVCNGIDDDCDGLTDEELLTTYYLDSDGDGYGYEGITIQACTVPQGYSIMNGDCNDSNGFVHPGTVEVCNSIDDDCDGLIDEGVQSTFYHDGDGDGYGNAMEGIHACLAPSGYVSDLTDCNDLNATIHPGANELNDDLDNDCDGLIDEGLGPANDEKAGAININVGQFAYCVPVYGSLIDATLSPEPGADVTTGEDLWYQFVAVSPGIRIECTSSTAYLLLELQNSSGVLLDTENAIPAAGNEYLNYGGLTIGALYYLRIRNYDSTQSTGTFSLCLRRLQRSGCKLNSVIGSGPYSTCNMIQAVSTGAQSYTFAYSSTTIPAVLNAPHYSNVTTTGGYTACRLSSLIPGMSYFVQVSCTYVLQNSAGVQEAITIVNPVPCTISIGAHAPVTLRNADSCPQVRSGNSIIGANLWICGASFYQWTFTPAGGGLSVTTNGSQPNRWLPVSQAIGAGLTPGTYVVQIRPWFYNGLVAGNFLTASCFQLSGAGIMYESEDTEFEPQFRRSAVESDSSLIYPNPCNGNSLHIRLSADELIHRLEVRDMSGRLARYQPFRDESSGAIDLHFKKPLAAGVYLLVITTDHGNRSTRFIVQH